ncbi:unnamed protein product [Phyllotreta striolata]|uniref:Uncharacterized protein n=1 Tax=Phyllotreta striolata TaxID=444603 RepID=A0A9N9XKK7_PHYSR|nr:unnamed protein product [Phyllotreta striolata]
MQRNLLLNDSLPTGTRPYNFVILLTATSFRGRANGMSAKNKQP